MRPAGGGPRFPVLRQKPASEGKHVADPVAARAGRGPAPESAGDHKVRLIDRTDIQCPVHHWNIRLREYKASGKDGGRDDGIWRHGVAAYSRGSRGPVPAAWRPPPPTPNAWNPPRPHCPGGQRTSPPSA